MSRQDRSRADGEGSIYEWPKGSGRWVAQLRVGDKLVRRRAATEREAKKHLKEMKKSQDNGVNLTLRQPTVNEWCAIWLERHTPHLRSRIREGYQSIIRNYVMSTRLGRIRLDKLSHDDIQAWVNELMAYTSARTGRPLAARTIRNALARLHKALTAAQISKYIAHNPADHVNLPSAEHKPIHKHVLTIEECQKLLGHLKGHRLYGLFFLALATGMRQAELLGLTWRSIDFRRGTLSISQQLQRQRARASGSDVAAKQWSLEPTKTKAGNRTLSMSTAVAGVLRNLQQQREEERANAGEAWCDTFVEDGDLLFTTSEGQPLYGSQIYKFLKSWLKQLGLPDITFHDLRHTAATLLLHEGYSSGSVAEIFGHSNKGVTDSIYAHGLVAVKVEALDRISRMLEYSGELPREEGTSTRNLGQNDRESSRDSHSDSQLPNDRKL